MKATPFALVCIGTVNLFASGAILYSLWTAHQRNRHAAVEAGLPLPPPRTVLRITLGLIAMLGVLLTYAVAFITSLE